MNIYLKTKLILLITLFNFLLILLPDSHAAPKRKTADIKNVYFLSTKNLQKQKLVCISSNGKLSFGVSTKKASATLISYLPFQVSKSEKSILKKAKSECNKKISGPDCKDSCDNDGDGNRDYPKDLQCSSREDASEEQTLTACSDGLDNDNDGKVDYPSDPGCLSSGDSGEDEQSGEVTAFSVFRKPFDNNYSIYSMFDHQYPQEFIHTDNVIITHDNEQTAIGIDGHQGYDYIMNEGTQILAAYDGTVIFAGEESPFFCPPLNSTVSGKAVRIRHTINNETFDSLYAHFSSISVSTGQAVTKGTPLGLSGNTGCSTGPHLHFDIQKITSNNSSSSASIDPAGWSVQNATDPWAIHSNGTTSIYLWAPGEAPREYRATSLSPNPNPSDNAPVAITYIQWAGSRDHLNPNNEYVELVLDSRYYSGQSYLLEGYTIMNNAGDSFTFPSGFAIQQGQQVKVFSGQGSNTSTDLYWNKTSGVWSNNGDCARLKRADGGLMYYVTYGSAGCAAGLQDKSSNILSSHISGGKANEIKERHNF